MEITISYNEKQEMMKIESDFGILFHGNYWDFKREPQFLYKLFVGMGLSVKLDKKLPAIK